MSKTTFFLLLTLISMASAANWAVLVAGSNSWFNYRHQSDVFHAYQVLLQKKMDPSKIIVFAYDDIANNTRNPFPGKVFNKPTYADPGVDVYDGVKIDYAGNTVTPTNFLNVLKGDKAAMKGIGSEKVLEMNENDNLFMFFSDHGAPNLIAFPSQYLYADQLLATFAVMKGKYNKISFYLEVIFFPIFSHVNQGQCLSISQPIPEFMPSPQQIQRNLLGGPTAHLMMLFKENILEAVWEICSVASLLKIQKLMTSQRKPFKPNLRKSELLRHSAMSCNGEMFPSPLNPLQTSLVQATQA